MLAENARVRWFPPQVGKSRFGNWLENNVDWAISRDRYWGTPMPLWRCDDADCAKIVCIGGRDDIAAHGGQVPEDLHRPHADHVVLVCESCRGPMHRVSEVVDVWFDSGSMPFAQWHYPFENQDVFESMFPADFICEGIDQSRGWFYSLLAIATLVKGRAPYRTVVANGLILDEIGRKMSKRLGNAADPWEDPGGGRRRRAPLVPRHQLAPMGHHALLARRGHRGRPQVLRHAAQRGLVLRQLRQRGRLDAGRRRAAARRAPAHRPLAPLPPRRGVDLHARGPAQLPDDPRRAHAVLVRAGRTQQLVRAPQPTPVLEGGAGGRQGRGLRDPARDPGHRRPAHGPLRALPGGDAPPRAGHPLRPRGADQRASRRLSRSRRRTPQPRAGRGDGPGAGHHRARPRRAHAGRAQGAPAPVPDPGGGRPRGGPRRGAPRSHPRRDQRQASRLRAARGDPRRAPEADLQGARPPLRRGRQQGGGGDQGGGLGRGARRDSPTAYGG